MVIYEVPLEPLAIFIYILYQPLDDVNIKGYIIIVVK